MNVTLSLHETMIAAYIGSCRQAGALNEGKRDKHGATADKAWSMHIEGAAGELAAAKALGIYWPATVGTYRDAPDLANLEVRTRSRHDYDLIIREDDPDETIYVLVTGRCPEFQVHGWLYAGEGKQEQWLQTYGNRRPAWFVPQGALRPIEHLHEQIDRRTA